MTNRASFFRRLLSNRSFTIGAALVGLVLLLALLAGYIAPFDPLKGNFRARMMAPNPQHWMGTDQFGRDILSRVLHGARISLQIGFMVALITAASGVLIGATSGYFRRLDGPIIIMRLMDAFMAFPSIILAIAISSVLGASVVNVVIALSIAATPHTARIVRASVMVVREMEFVEAARALGAGHTRILLRHILANAMAPPKAHRPVIKLAHSSRRRAFKGRHVMVFPWPCRLLW
ncbi:MAG: ABC transporter permease [Betaproteobacteria bacterium]|nr:ABC transporter permease [Betaproteobacteria bacterium]